MQMESFLTRTNFRDKKKRHLQTGFEILCYCMYYASLGYFYQIVACDKTFMVILSSITLICYVTVPLLTWLIQLCETWESFRVVALNANVGNGCD